MAMMRPPTDTTSESRVIDVQGGNHNFNMDNGTSPKKKGSVQVKLELGHKALTRKRATAEGFTHDWTMFVRGPEGSNIQHFVDRVVFHLHESFPKPKRVVKDPPYQINESGYAGFNLPIEIYFKNKDDPKKIIFSYDLFLHTPHSPPVNHVRCEKLTFQNPSEEFRRKLVKAGGMAILGPNDQQGQTPSVTQNASPTPSQPHTPEEFADLFSVPPKPEARKASPPTVEPPKSSPPKSESTSQRKHKSNSSKERPGGRGKLSSSSSQGSNLSPPIVTPPSTVTPPNTPSKELQPVRVHSSNSGSKHKDKTAKRSLEAQPNEGSKKKRKGMGTQDQTKERDDKKQREKRDREKLKEREDKEKGDKEKGDKEKGEKEKGEKEKGEKEKEKGEKEKGEKERKKEKKSSSKELKSKHKSSKKDVKLPKVNEPPKSSSAMQQGQSTPPVQPPPLAQPEPEPVPEPTVTPIVVKTLAAKKQQPSALQMLDELSLGEISGFEDDMDMDIDIPAEMIADVCSPASTLSFSSMKGTTGGEGGGPLGALFAEMDDDEVPLSPLPPTSDSPPPLSQLPQPQIRITPPQTLLHKPPKIIIGSPGTAKESVVPPVDSVPPPPPAQCKEPSPPAQEPKPVPGKAKKRDKESRRSRTDRRTKEASKENKEVPAAKPTPKDIAKDLFRDYRSENVANAVDVKSTATAASGAKDAPATNTDLGERDINNISLQGHQPGVVAPNGESLNVLLELQRRLMGMTDRDLVQQVVNVIEETGMYKISDATFDFDLCSLDIYTVKKLQVCLEMSC